MPIPICMNPRGCIKYEPIDTTPLTLSALEAGSTIKLAAVTGESLGKISLPSMKYRTGNIETGIYSNWYKYSLGNTITLQNIGDSIQFWNQSSRLNYYTQTDSGPVKYLSRFQMTGQIKVSGNLQSLLNFSRNCTEPWNFKFLFASCTSLIDASQLLLGARCLSYGCYEQLFQNCSGLLYGPECSSTLLAEQCYVYMFGNYWSLISGPSILPAVNLPISCYMHMFQNCSDLITAPVFRNILTNSTNSMFGMFQSCSKLTHIRIPDLTPNTNSPAYTFYNCSRLTNIEVDFTNWGSAQSFSNWLTGVSSTGTFTKPSALPEEYGPSRIPSGWTVINK